MARPLKSGVIYFPKDTDFYEDDKVKVLRAEFGAKGMYLLDVLLCELYGKDGYYMRWDSTKCRLMSDGARCGITPSFAEEFVRGCCRCSYFDKGVFSAFSVLTSRGIQKRYIRMFNSRTEIRIIRDYWLLDETDSQDVPQGSLSKLVLIDVNGTENPDKSTENSLNEIKLNKTSDDGDGNARARVREIALEIWGRELSPYEYELAVDLYRPLGGLTEDNYELFEEAVKAASKANRMNFQYVSNCFRKYRERGIRDNDDYWQYEFQRDKGG